jgi:hypothetical protein
MGNVEVKRITQDESWRVFDRTARRLLNISGEEFSRRWDRGDYAERDAIDVMQVAMLRPGGR